ncbi:MAG: replication-associated recombination protein A [Candidatus Krumholzibacteriota bacterium]|nr:replication-associated recombination protein A [Candidatus Krumholzibacteriota bacterium]
MGQDLFSRDIRPPLAERMRPRNLDEFLGQDEIIGEGKLLRRVIDRGRLESSIIFWGPPGCGKTTLAHLIAGSVDSHFVFFSAVTSGIADVRRIVAEADQRLRTSGVRTILFIDEIHRFNKAQQDAFLPHIENGTIVLIGATTENPSFEVIAPLLSRSRVFVLRQLEEKDIVEIMKRTLTDSERGFGKKKISVSDQDLFYLSHLAAGDARTALNAFEMVVESLDDGGDRLILTRDSIEEAAQTKRIFYDKKGERHFNIISALHKSLRGSDPDAGLYWLARMLEAGEDPLYVARRLVRFASEDIGNADPQALSIAMAAAGAVRFTGMPECKLALAQAVTYMALAPKSNSLYRAYGEAASDVSEYGDLPVPMAIRNAPTSLMKETGYGEGYKYPHDDPDSVVDQEYFPEELAGKRYYHPADRGFERDMIKRLEYWQKVRMKKRELERS